MCNTDVLHSLGVVALAWLRAGATTPKTRVLSSCLLASASLLTNFTVPLSPLGTEPKVNPHYSSIIVMSDEGSLRNVTTIKYLCCKMEICSSFSQQVFTHSLQILFMHVDSM